MFELFQLQLKTAQIMVDAHGVIGMRMLGIAGVMPSEAGETRLMVTEKQNAFASAGLAATGAMLAGKTPAQAYDMALEPIGHATRANARRLTRLDPR